MVKKVLKIILIIVLIMFLLLIGLLMILKNLASKPVKSDYYNYVDSRGVLEKKYTSYGEFEVNSIEFESNEELFDNYKIWYPTKLEENNNEKYPIVVFVNGTGVPYQKYGATFEHLASWGFVVIGNDDANSASGKSSSITLDYILSLNSNEESIFFNKLDITNVGISGHSQGGVGAINAVTEFDNSNVFTSIYTASTTSIELANALEWNYDVTKISIPYFMVAGTGKVDAETIAPLESMVKNYMNLNSNIKAVMARRKNTDHGDMLLYADGYMTAWFRYTLMNDDEAGKVFLGDSAEILSNSSNWQDVRIR
ncbi:alpha/beta hydrolase [Clostridium sp. 1001271B_151109_B4]|uniref:poly(ethylene terephthalate) hydrolase family protein n=1 Tax=Clostridium sp. 1001271B_151109_B4 TaxID=2787148 RepID=UPI0018A88EBC|nr:alpha/beta hydrolase [Clostridium sp. 1001271B_151109_B4]